MIDIAYAASEALREEAAQGPAALFGLNAKLFIAQLLNFAVVLLVLWKWAYTPLVKLLEDRSQKIEKGLADAAAAEERLNAAGKEREKVVAEARAESRRLLEATKAQAASAITEARGQAKAEAEKVMTQARAAIEADREKMGKELQAETVNLVVTLTERLLREKLSDEKDKKIVEEMMKQVRV